MAHLDFNYPGLGEAYRIFSQKHARLLTVRERTEQPLAQQVHRMEEELHTRRAAVDEVDEDPYAGSYERRATTISILDLFDQDREWTRRVLRTVREMELGYLVAMTDAFVGRWREENHLPAGRQPESRWWYPATEEKINLTIADLHANRSDIPLRVLRADTAMRLKSIREQRDAVMHRDSVGVDDITEADLDAAVPTLNSLARALAFVTHAPLPQIGGVQQREAFIAEALEPG